jgi:hypothetical protein
MLKRIRGARVSFKTFAIVVAVALLVWAAVVYVQIRDFMPDELVETSDSAGEARPK